MKIGADDRPARKALAAPRPPAAAVARPARRSTVLGLGIAAAGTFTTSAVTTSAVTTGAITTGAVTAGALSVARRARAQASAPGATEDRDLAAAVAAFAGGVPVRAGRVRLEVAELVDNGNTVPLAVAVEAGPGAGDRVVAIAVFNERNPQRDVAVFHFGPRAGRATVATRIRLATSQKLAAVAKLADGSCWSDTVDVVVTLAACIEGETS
ncbi:MAG: thiosulfate oxidation carrier protein SoxY [Lautropia sp.]